MRVCLLNGVQQTTIEKFRNSRLTLRPFPVASDNLTYILTARTTLKNSQKLHVCLTIPVSVCLALGVREISLQPFPRYLEAERVSRQEKIRLLKGDGVLSAKDSVEPLYELPDQAVSFNHRTASRRALLLLP